MKGGNDEEKEMKNEEPVEQFSICYNNFYFQ
jgi:hypothetical protein